jgi:hypothetical protein
MISTTPLRTPEPSYPSTFAPRTHNVCGLLPLPSRKFYGHNRIPDGARLYCLLLPPLHKKLFTIKAQSTTPHHSNRSANHARLSLPVTFFNGTSAPHQPVTLPRCSLPLYHTTWAFRPHDSPSPPPSICRKNLYGFTAPGSPPSSHPLPSCPSKIVPENLAHRLARPPKCWRTADSSHFYASLHPALPSHHQKSGSRYQGKCRRLPCSLSPL